MVNFTIKHVHNILSLICKFMNWQQNYFCLLLVSKCLKWDFMNQHKNELFAIFEMNQKFLIIHSFVNWWIGHI